MTHEEMDRRTFEAIKRDEHYLRRIDRLNPSHAELALSLYRDDELIKTLLRELDFPDGAERIAISLGDDEQGPFVVVTRAGHFVTCLGEGMSKGDLPLVTRADLDRLSHHVQAVRQLLHDLKTGDQRETKRLFERVLQSGDRLTREQFSAISRWLPLLRDTFMQAYFRTFTNVSTRQEVLHHAKKLTAHRYERHLKPYWQEAWALSHYCLLLGSDGGSMLQRFYGFDEVDAEMEGAAALFFGMPAALGLSSTAARSAWLVGRLPEVFVDSLEEGWSTYRDAEWTTAFGLGLYATGLLHPERRPDLLRVLAYTYEHDGTPRYAVDTAVRNELSAQHALGVKAEDESREETLRRARTAAVELARREPELCARWGDPAELPDDALPAWLLSVPCDLFDEIRGLRCLAEWLPWVMPLSAEQLYLPEAYMPSTAHDWQPAWTLSLLSPRLRLQRALEAKPRRVEKKPGRNDPCSCGSGRKYKRCCGVKA